MNNINPHRPLHHASALLARVLLGAIFVWSGYGKAIAATGTIAYFAKLGLPSPTLAYAVAVTIELGVGLSFITGLFARPAALVLAFWCIATALVGHTNSTTATC
jgi:putative oxidoreductase